MSACLAYISVGSNLGQRRENCRLGIAALAAVEGVKLLAQSRYFLTEPVNYAEQQWFVNGVVKIQTELAPLALLDCLQAIEIEAGRQPANVRYGPRVLDLDIIFYADDIIDSAQLKIPHPQMHKRLFVLSPFCDIDPTIMHPVFKKTVGQLSDFLLAADKEKKKVMVYP